MAEYRIYMANVFVRGVWSNMIQINMKTTTRLV
jgi:hypothetical protein